MKDARELYLRPYFNFIPDNHPPLETLSDDEWEDFTEEMKIAKESYDNKQEETRLENERLKKAKEKAEKELKDKKEAEEKVEKNRLAEIEKELNKGDTAKIKDLIKDLEDLKTKYTFKSKRNKLKYIMVGGLIEKLINYIKE